MPPKTLRTVPSTRIIEALVGLEQKCNFLVPEPNAGKDFEVRASLISRRGFFSVPERPNLSRRYHRNAFLVEVGSARSNRGFPRAPDRPRIGWGRSDARGRRQHADRQRG